MEGTRNGTSLTLSGALLCLTVIGIAITVEYGTMIIHHSPYKLQRNFMY